MRHIRRQYIPGKQRLKNKDMASSGRTQWKRVVVFRVLPTG